MNRTLTLLLFIPFLFAYRVSATHIAGGQIFYKNLNSLTVEITFVGYRDQNGVPFGLGVFDFGDGDVYGDETDEVLPWANIKDLGGGLEKWEFTLVHTYSNPGYYEVSYTEDFRKSNSNNIEGSVNNSFHVDALVSLDPFLNGNTSPGNDFFPSFRAVSGHKNIFNLSMFDEDGDSLSYKIGIPLKGDGLNVDGYRSPADLSFYESGSASPVFELEPFSGNLIWDAPGEPGEYSMAIKTEEWRKVDGKFLRIGYTVLDFIVEVVKADSFHNVVVPMTNCRSAQESYTDQIIIENSSQAALSIRFSTGMSALTFNGQSATEWNESNIDTKFSDAIITIDVEMNLEEASNYTGLNAVYVQVSGDYFVMDSSERNLSTTTGFMIGFDCSPDELILSASGEIAELPFFSITQQQIRLHSNFDSDSHLKLYDVKGNLLFDADVALSQGNQSIPFNFEFNTPYIIVLAHKKGILTEKFLLTK
ncbi:MAG: hypothetical protein RIM99_06860 [Cyclobacteriaceae bacterium]